MNRKKLLLAVVALLVAGGLFTAWLNSRTQALSDEPSEANARVDVSQGAGSGTGAGEGTRVGMENPTGGPDADHPPRPPEPNRRFIDFTPEERVDFARRGHGPGG